MKKQITYIDNKFKALFVASTFAMLIEYLMTLIDKILSGHFINAYALSAITLVEPFTLIVAFIACILSGITGAPMSIALGKGDKKKAEQYLSQSLILAFIFGVGLTLIYVFFFNQLTNSVASGTEAYPYVCDYFRYLRFIPLPMLLNAVLYPAVLYRGGEKYCNLSAVFSVVVNVLVSVLLCLKIGILGIGIGSVAGSCACLIPLIFFMMSDKGKIQFTFYLSFKDLKSNLIYSLGYSLTYFYLAVFQMIMNAFLVNTYGSDSIVIFTGISNVIGLINALSVGIVEFLIPMLNTYKGENNQLGCKKTMMKAIKASFTEGIVMTIFLMIFASELAFLFGIDDPALCNQFTQAVRIYAISTCFFYIIDIYSRYYLYMGKVKLSLFIGFLKSFACPLIFAIVMGKMFGLMGIWYGMGIAQIILFLFAYCGIKMNKNSGRYILFLDEDVMDNQYIYNVNMTQENIMALIQQVRETLEVHHVSKDRINKIALFIEESQISELEIEGNNNRVIIECSLLIGDEITLILRNTGYVHDVFNDNEEQNLSRDIMVGMRAIQKNYFTVNGNNRLILKV